MVSNRWFKTLASFALLGLVVFTAGATVADIPAGGAPNVALSHCLEGLRQETGSVLPSQLADRDTCAQLEQIDASFPHPATAASQTAFASGFMAFPALPAQPATWRDAGAARPQAAPVYYTPGDDGMDAGVSQR